jgi:hypothetical protein
MNTFTGMTLLLHVFALTLVNANKRRYEELSDAQWSGNAAGAQRRVSAIASGRSSTDWALGHGTRFMRADPRGKLVLDDIQLWDGTCYTTASCLLPILRCGIGHRPDLILSCVQDYSEPTPKRSIAPCGRNDVDGHKALCYTSLTETSYKGWAGFLL